MEGGLSYLKVICNSTLLIFYSPQRKLSIPRLLIASLLFSLCTYQTGYTTWMNFKRSGEDLISSVSMFFWNIKTYVSLILIIYWQFNHLPILLSPQTWSHMPAKNLPKLPSYFIYLFVIFNVVFVILMQIWFGVEYYLPHLASVYNGNVYEGFGERMGSISILLDLYMNVVWILSMLLYFFVLEGLYRRLAAFNEGLDSIGLENKEIATQLLTQYRRLKRLTSLIRTVNSTFEIYTFMMIGSGVGLSVVVLSTFFDHHEELTLSSLHRFIATLLNLVELVVLAIYPAQIHSAIQNIEAKMFENERIWFPQNEQTYLIANSMIAHSKQEDLGVSLWSFVIIRKSMVLTVASLVFTYLLMVNQMNSGSNCCVQSNETSIGV